jgi:hypothetical protein
MTSIEAKNLTCELCIPSTADDHAGQAGERPLNRPAAGIYDCETAFARPGA